MEILEARGLRLRLRRDENAWLQYLVADLTPGRAGRQELKRVSQLSVGARISCDGRATDFSGARSASWLCDACAIRRGTATCKSATAA